MDCQYCQSKNSEEHQWCTFCNAPLVSKRPQQKNLLTVEHAERSFQELIQYHTYDLLVLLRLVRLERSTAYDAMISIKRLLRKLSEATGGPQNASDNEVTVKDAENDYRLQTARMKLLEGILIDRMGYKPTRVDDKLLESLQTKIQKNA